MFQDDSTIAGQFTLVVLGSMVLLFLLAEQVFDRFLVRHAAGVSVGNAPPAEPMTSLRSQVIPPRAMTHYDKEISHDHYE